MLRLLASLLALAAAPAVSAQVVTVTTCEDAVDIPANASAGDLPGPDGLVSFREALIVTNGTPGPQTVAFAIPQDDWWLFSDYAALKLEDGIFFVTDDGTTLDFASQTAITGDTNPAGMEVGVYGLQPNGWGLPAIVIKASDCVVKGLGPVSQRGSSVSIDGGTNNRVIGCVTGTIQLDPQPGTTRGNIIGGVLPGEANTLDVVEMFCGSDDNVVIGNAIGSVRVIGSPYCADAIEFPRRNRIGGPTPAERNVLSGTGSYGSEGFPVGQNVEVLWARDTLVQGNFIGVTADGLQRVPQIGPSGVTIADSFDTTVRDNLIAGMYVVGINHYAGDLFGRAIHVTAINADTQGVVIENNLVGTDVTGSAPILTLNGVEVSQATALRSVSDVRVGGCEPGQANTIAFTEQTGVRVTGSGVDATVSCNSIHDNGLLGIDLGSFFGGIDGVTANDPLDADDGGNGLQNTPELLSVMRVGDDLHVEGALHSSPGDAFSVEVFASPACDPSGSGEGQLVLGVTTVNTDAAGDATFDLTLPGPLTDGWVLAATATLLSTGSTSEFSTCAATAWRDEGHALAGVSGEPRLVGLGDLAGGSTSGLRLSGAAPSALAGLFLSLTGTPTPFKGGQLVPLPVLVAPIVVNLDGDGALEFSFALPAGVPGGTELWCQWVVVDAAAVQGLALSNAVMGLTP